MAGTLRPVRLGLVVLWEEVLGEEVLDAELDKTGGIPGHTLYHRSVCVNFRRVGIPYRCLAVHCMQVEDSRSGWRRGRVLMADAQPRRTFCQEQHHRWEHYH